MIKEIFDIEPVQKNSLIIFLGILSLTFLQVYLFKPELIDKGVFIVVGICLAITVCWYVISILPLVLFFKATSDDDEKNSVRVETIVFICGLFGLAWIILLTYIAYEFNLNLKNFIRGSIIVVILRSFFWLIWGNYSQQKKI